MPEHQLTPRAAWGAGLPIMIDHHQGAIQMVDELWHYFADPRVLLMADSIRHAQRSQIRRMQALHASKAGRIP
jgi:uncharacterized protein (DUF305 family)